MCVYGCVWIRFHPRPLSGCRTDSNVAGPGNADYHRHLQSPLPRNVTARDMNSASMSGIVNPGDDVIVTDSEVRKRNVDSILREPAARNGIQVECPNWNPLTSPNSATEVVERVALSGI